jgi:hypothetical protein
MSEPERFENGFGFKTPVASGHVSGRWGAILILTAVALVTLVGAVGYGLWLFQQSLERMHEEHSDLIGYQKQQAEAADAASCIAALPPEGDDRIAALKSGSPCYYAKFIYIPKPTEPKIIIVPSTATPPKMPMRPSEPGRLQERAPGPPIGSRGATTPTWPASGAPASGASR